MIKQGMTRFFALLALVCLIGVAAKAQDVATNTADDVVTVKPLFTAPMPAATPAAKPKPRPAIFGSMGGADVFLGYSYLNNGYTNADEMFDGRFGVAGGYNLQFTAWLNNYLGMTADFSGHNTTAHRSCGAGCSTSMTQDSYYFLFGPTVAHTMGNARIFAHALVGLNRADVIEREDGFFEEALEMNTGFAAGIGGGIEWWHKRWAWRLLQADYLWSTMDACTGGHVNNTECVESVHNFRISTGLTLHFGHR